MEFITRKMNKTYEMILRAAVFLFVIEVLIPPCHPTMELTVDPKKRKSKIKYCFIPRCPIRLLYEPMENSQGGSYSTIRPPADFKVGSFDSTSGSLQNDFRIDNMFNSLLGSLQCNSRLGSQRCAEVGSYFGRPNMQYSSTTSNTSPTVQVPLNPNFERRISYDFYGRPIYDDYSNYYVK